MGLCAFVISLFVYTCLLTIFAQTQEIITMPPKPVQPSISPLERELDPKLMFMYTCGTDPVCDVYLNDKHIGEMDAIVAVEMEKAGLITLTY
jgi:hypothetical protein